MIFLKDRTIIEINGSDSKSFLQGLITNDINKATEKNLIYSCMLSASGRFLYDFFIFTNSDKLIIDCARERRDEICKKLGFYKLRAQVKIEKNDEILVGFSDKITTDEKNLIFKDPRKEGLGNRIYFNKSDNLNLTDDNYYHYKRISLKIPESENDLTYEKSIILEFDFDNLNAIDYQKGCYIGQELTARTHYKGQIRKKIAHVKIENLKEIAKNSEIFLNKEEVGIILSSCLYNSELHALALIKIGENNLHEKENECYYVGDNKLRIIS